MAEILKIELFEGIEGANQFDAMYGLTDEEAKEFEDLRTEINKILPKIKPELYDSIQNRIDEIRKEIANILSNNIRTVEPYEGIENEYEHHIINQLNDNEVDKIQELRKEIDKLKELQIKSKAIFKEDKTSKIDDPLKNRQDEIRKEIANILSNNIRTVEPYEGIENEYEHHIINQLDEHEVDRIQELREELNKIKELERKTKGIPKDHKISKPEDPVKNRMDEIRKEIAKILSNNIRTVEPYEGIENEYEHHIINQLDDYEIDRIQELREELNKLKDIRRKKPEKSKGKTEPDETKRKTEPDETKRKTEPDETKRKTEPDETKRKTEPDETKRKTEPDESKGKTEPDESKGKTEPDEPDYSSINDKLLRYIIESMKDKKEEIQKEYNILSNDMLDKFYGNKEKEKEYRKRIKEFKSHIVKKEFKYLNEEGKPITGEYYTIEPYEGYENDAKFLQLEEYKNKIEKITKSKYLNLYENPEEYEKDVNYVTTNNSAYNRLKFTEKNLTTLGKFGEKAPTIPTMSMIPVVRGTKGAKVKYLKNGFKHLGNGFIHIANGFIHARNAIIAPINRLEGKIVTPIYAGITGSRDTTKSKGIYDNKRTHRFKARTEYFQKTGNGYFKSKLLAITKAKEGNKAILNAGSQEILENLKSKYFHISMNDAYMKAKDTDLFKNIDESFLKETDFKKQLEIVKKAQDLTQIINKKDIETIQTDPVDYRTHDIANKENITRLATLAKLGIRKYIGPKIENILMSKTRKEIIVNKQVVENIPKKQPGKYIVDESCQDIIKNSSGKNIEGYYSVSGGEYLPENITIKPNDKIRAIFFDDGKIENSLGDGAGLNSPEFTIGNFDSKLQGTDNILNQDNSISKLIEAIGQNPNSKSAIEKMYVSINEDKWIKLSKLLKSLPPKEILEPSIKTVGETIYVANPYIANALKTLGILDASEIVYDNLRETNSETKSSKEQVRNYNAKTPYVGSKKEDYEKMGKISLYKNTTVHSTTNSKSSEKDDEER